MKQSGGENGKPWMGPLPASSGCDCQICRPEPSYDPEDRRSIDTILEHGWQVIVISDEADCSSPEHAHDGHEHPDPVLPFAYTVGLGHRAGHPELLMSGLDRQLMHRAINGVARRVMDGRRLLPGDALEGVLGTVPVVLERVADDALSETVLWSGWFHRRKPEALVIVWPSTSGLFPWQPGAPDVLDALQPRHWREPMEHTGGVAVVPEWVFPVPPDRMAFTCAHVLENGEAILRVLRETDDQRGEDWCILCGAAEHATDDLRIVHISHLVRSAPSLVDVGGLELDHGASRDDVDSPWRTFRLD